jgi:probable aminopeptidase NPEPL1
MMIALSSSLFLARVAMLTSIFRSTSSTSRTFSNAFVVSKTLSRNNKVLTVATTSPFIDTRNNNCFKAGAFYSSSTKLFAATPATSLSYTTSFNDQEYNATVIVGKKEALGRLLTTAGKEDDGDFFSSKLNLQVPKSIMETMLDSINVKTGGTASTYTTTNTNTDTNHQVVQKLLLCGLPTKISRNNHPMAVHTLATMVGNATPEKGTTRIIVLTDDSESTVGPLASAIAKAFPLFTMKTSKTPPKERHVKVVFYSPTSGNIITNEVSLKAAQAVSDGVQLAGRLVDTHPEEMTTDQMANECRTIAAEFPDKLTFQELVGEELQAYGGLYAVGKAATCPPRLILMEYNGGQDDDTKIETVALVGKGIVYDTGGLSLKSKSGMCGMKHDMGGAAGLLGGFYSAVKLGVKKKVHLILCLAENTIGPEAFRNDDILKMYSGKTVEVNNCDAEGRLVLGDGVSHATKHIPNLDLLVDMATLTGAQLVATGKIHAGILANTQQVEQRAVAAGMRSGDLCFPLLYAPELLMHEFKSKVADMKNSVKDRSNAQTSCAGHFIEAHIEEEYKGGWLHVVSTDQFE